MDSKNLKILSVVIVAICIGQLLHAQNHNELNLIVQQATASAQNNDFTTAKQNYDAAISIVAKQPNSDLILAVPENLSEYIIITQAKTNPEEAQKCALTLLELQMHCLSYCAYRG